MLYRCPDLTVIPLGTRSLYCLLPSQNSYKTAGLQKMSDKISVCSALVCLVELAS